MGLAYQHSPALVALQYLYLFNSSVSSRRSPVCQWQSMVSRTPRLCFLRMSGKPAKSHTPRYPLVTHWVLNKWSLVSDGICKYVSHSLSLTSPSLFRQTPLRRNTASTAISCNNAFYRMNMSKFRLRFHWNLLPRAQLTIFHHWSGNVLAPARRQAIIWINDG